ncbi:MAG TPA: inorganic diphosphatase [Vicinamibacterales bacterium]|nr:inorganic diphosphatase [Vicinamibacterales bacterium]
MIRLSALVVAVAVVGFSQAASHVPDTLPARATAKLGTSLDAAKPHAKHLWRDTPPINADGTINGYIEIARGDRQKWEFDIAKHERALDRVIPESIGGYPINYGIVPQTVSYDGDPFDILVLGPPIEGGTFVRGLPVGLMLMEDDHIVDSKVVVTPLGADGKALYEITETVRREVTSFFNRYKSHEPEASTSVPGWGTGDAGMALVRQTHAFFLQCRGKSGDCPIALQK